MPKWGYSIIQENIDPEKTAKASGRELKVSHKAAREVAQALRGMDLTKAKDFLRDVIAKNKPVPYTRYTKKLGHKGGMQNCGVGRYPIKCADAVLGVLQAAQANAENKGLDVDRLRIMHSAAYPGMKTKTLHAKSTRQSITKIRNHHPRRNRARRETIRRRAVNEHSKTIHNRIHQKNRNRRISRKET